MDGDANPTARNQITGWVPLHEAAWKGHLECCKKLLERRGEIKFSIEYVQDFDCWSLSALHVSNA